MMLHPFRHWQPIRRTTHSRIQFMGRIRLRYLSIPMLLAGMAACGDPSVSPGAPLVLYDGEPNRDDALLEGILIVEPGCLYIEVGLPTYPSSTRFLIAFPRSETGWSAANQELRFAGGSYRNGEPIAVGGGGAFPEYDWSVPPDPSCDTSNMWMAGP